MSEFVALDDPRVWVAKGGTGPRAGRGGVAPTVDDLQKLQDQAREEGRAEGMAEGRARAAGDVARIKQLGATLSEAQQALETSVAEGVLDLALDIARAVLHESLRTRRDLMLPVVREAMRAMPSGAAAQIVLNPADVELLRAHLGEEWRVAGWQIVEDHRIQPGGCRLVSPHCEVDATLASRWKRIAAALGKDHGWLDG
jgi:flagellar assembly protein FliH